MAKVQVTKENGRAEQLIMTSEDAATLRELMRLMAVLVARREQKERSSPAPDSGPLRVLFESTLHDDVLLNQVCCTCC